MGWSVRRGSLWPLLLLLAPVMSFAAAPSTTPASAAAQGAPAARMLVASARGVEETFSFVIGPCSGKAPTMKCAFSVRLMRADTVLATLSLNPIWSDRAEPLAPSSAWGMGDPLDQPKRWQAWRIGQGEDSVVLGASLIRLGNKHEGLLLRRVYRGEARHMLIVRRDSTLSAVEIDGRWSAISVRPRGTERDQLVLLAQWPGEPGFVWANEPTWDESAETLVYDYQRATQAYLVALGPYTRQEEAVAVAKAGCLPGAVVAPTDPYDAPAQPGGWIAAAVTGEVQLGQKALDAIKRCVPSPPAFIAPLRFRWVPRIRYPLTDQKRVEIGLGAYDGKGWPLTMVLADSSRVLDRLPLEWPASVPVMAPAHDVDLPAGDPLRPWRGEAGWALGDLQTAELVAIRPLRLQEHRPAFMLSLEVGFEHRKRRHAILTVDNDHWRMGWQAMDREGPSWSTVVVRPRSEGSDEILHFSFFEESASGQVDSANITRIAWDDKKHELLESPLVCDGGLSLVVTRTFAKIEQALAAKAQSCASSAGSATTNRPSPLVLPAPRGSGLRGYVLAYPTTDKSASRKLVTEAAKCWPHTHPTILPWCKKDN
jgi:hypothetical protein